MSNTPDFVLLEGTRLAFIDRGEGIPVVFLHPTPFDHVYWLPVVERLSGVRSILVDLRGHGASELGSEVEKGLFAAVPDAPVLTMQRLGRDVLAILDHLAISEAIFVGCSIGGYVVLELWRQAPERVQGLGFVCSKAQPDAEANIARRVQTIADARNGKRESLFDSMTNGLIGATSRRNRPEIVAEMRARMTVSDEALVAVQAGLATRPDSLPTIETIEAPILAIAGGEDPGVSPPEMQAFYAAPGGCEFHLLADAGHLAAYEQPEKVAAILQEWLDSLHAEV